LAAVCLAVPFAARAQTPESPRPARKLAYAIVNVFPHDTSAFTEGLFIP